MDKLVGLATDITKTLEKNIKYQISGIVVFISYSLGFIAPGNNNAFVVFGLEIPASVIEIVCPILFLFWLSKFAINAISLYRLSEEIDKQSKKDIKFFILHCPRSMFMSVLFSDKVLRVGNSGHRLNVKRFSNFFHIAILFIIPGINMALTTYSIWSSHRLSWIITLFIIYIFLLLEIVFQISKAKKSIRKTAISITLFMSFSIGTVLVFCIFQKYEYPKSDTKGKTIKDMEDLKVEPKDQIQSNLSKRVNLSIEL